MHRSATLLIVLMVYGRVPVASAQHPGVESEVYIDSRHARLQRHQETVAEVKRILRLHAAFVGD